MIQQLTVFLSNSKGRISAMCRTMGEAGIQMSSLTIADTADYGIARIICEDPEKAILALREANFTASLTKVVAVNVPDVPGGLADIMEALEKADINVEYSYCFAHGEKGAVTALKAPEAAEEVLAAAGFEIVNQ